MGGSEHALGVAGKADDVEHQAETVRQAIETFGSADLLVNNTGINAAYGLVVELDLGAARKTLEVNGIAALSWVQQVHRAWRKEHGGAVVNVSSVAGIRCHRCRGRHWSGAGRTAGRRGRPGGRQRSRPKLLHSAMSLHAPRRFFSWSSKRTPSKCLQGREEYGPGPRGPPDVAVHRKSSGVVVLGPLNATVPSGGR